MDSTNRTRHFDLVLVGGGHSNIQVIKNLSMNPINGLRVTLISDVAYAPYSGMLPGHLAGWYDFDQAHFDLRAICESAGFRFIKCPVTKVVPESKTVCLKGRPSIEFDVLSINVGIAPSPLELSTRQSNQQSDHQENLFPLKPISELLKNWRSFLSQVDELPKEKKLKVSVIGGGAAGVEVSIIIALTLKEKGITNKITLISKTDSILSSHNQKVQKLAYDSLRTNGIEILTGQEVKSFDGSHLSMDADSIESDYVFIATNATAPNWLKESGLSTDSDGFLFVDQTLKVAEQESIFGAGDCINFNGQSLVKAGVYAVRQGPILAENIRNHLLGKKLRFYRPQKNLLALIVSGKKQSIASFGPFALRSKSLWHWKDRIDRKFMTRFQSIDASMEEAPSDRANRIESVSRKDFSPNTCGGCGSKVSPEILSTVLEELKANKEYLLSSDLGHDDAAIHKFKTDDIVVSNLDAFRSFIDDPYLFAEIAVEHALNDIYAMGAKPKSAQILAALQANHPLLTTRDLKQMMHGVCRRLSLAEVELSGGHTIESETSTIGVQLFGTAHKVTPKTITQDNLSLILTKPVGTGAILKANMMGKAKGLWVDEILHSMRLNQAQMLEHLLKYGVTALTDVTGFGLLGHAFEMIRKKDELALEIDVSRIPVFSGFHGAVDLGFESTITSSNWDFVSQHVQGYQNSGHQKSENQKLWSFLVDPQTSGGLLAALPSHLAEDCIAEMSSLTSEARIIGRTIPQRGPAKIELI